jgi:curved DNA-binding protein CbpA
LTGFFFPLRIQRCFLRSHQSAVTDYYKILGVRRTANQAEIKSAYRKLARVRHPDVNPGSEAAAKEFALLSRAYHILSDPRERAYYDEELSTRSGSNYSILHSNNPHARRARNVAIQARWDRVVDEVLQREREENRERQRAVFTTVSLFLSTFFVAMMRPHFWQVFDVAGRAVVLTLFVIGVWHLATRLREYFAHYTYIPKPIQDSIMRQEEKPEQPFTRFSAYTFLLLGYMLSVGIGLLIGWHTQDFFNDLALLFRHEVEVVQSSMLAYTSATLLVPDLIVYPPIAVLIVDTMHAVASRID